jgi:hypothetical protein
MEQIMPKNRKNMSIRDKAQYLSRIQKKKIPTSK